jgi:hypothetical protein|uniref:Uncharacterized protein n=1 Tax=Siphoviridae sp. ct0Wl9 TaxID=2827763 RepID=A0A8S5T8X3_9CAUD|nr:MAG TPA: hypothetical protein [Siphoviridae sp. ct0Wl9]
MNNILILILTNLEKIGVGIGLFMGAYLANMGLGVWKNVKVDGSTFDWTLIKKSIVKFIVLILSIALLSIVVSVIPAYATYVGIEISQEVLETIDALVIIGAFLTATVRYVGDAVSKLKTILGN